jgi:hypothetical protein
VRLSQIALNGSREGDPLAVSRLAVFGHEHHLPAFRWNVSEKRRI